MLSGLIQQFESLANELTIAVRCGHEAEVQALDLQLQRLIGRIFAVHARSRGDISAQIGFFNRLAVRDCDDGVSVRRYTGMMTALFHRYLEPDAGARPGPRAKTQHLLPNGYDPSVHEMLLDSVPERVAVISLDFRYIYCNAPNAAFHAKAEAEVSRAQHFNNAEEYRKYLALVSEGRDRIHDPAVSVPWRDCEFVRTICAGQPGPG